jgi:general secretion pathway protein N
MKRRRWSRVAGAAGVLLAAYLGALLALFPAGLLWRLVEPRLELPFALDLGTVSGTAWQGRADGLRAGGRKIGTVAWRLRPAVLLSGRLGVDLRWSAGADQVDLRLRLGRGDTEIRALRGGLDAARLQAWFGLPVLLEGRVELDVPLLRMAFDTGFDAAEGAVLWTGAGGGLPRPIPLGQFRARLALEDAMLRAAIESAPESPLQAEGSAGWGPVSGYLVDLTLQAGPNAAPVLQSALNSIGPRQPDGSHRLRLRGQGLEAHG